MDIDPRTKALLMYEAEVERRALVRERDRKLNEAREEGARERRERAAIVGKSSEGR